MEKQMIIDFHNHYFPPEYLDALSEGDRDRAVRVMIEHLDELESQLDLEDDSAPEVDLREALSGL